MPHRDTTSGSTDLFTDASVDATAGRAPLAVRMRPRTIDELVGQQHLLGAGSPLRHLVRPGTGGMVSVVLWGPPGSGKTTVAYLVGSVSGRDFVELSAVTAGVKDLRAVIDQARRTLSMYGRETVVFIDEVHRFSKSQQDALLPAVENRWVTLVAATTENPSFSVISPLLSRSILLTLAPLTDDDIAAVIDRAVVDDRGLAGTVELAPSARTPLIRFAAGDARRALTALEAGAAVAMAEEPRGPANPVPLLTVEQLTTAIDHAVARYDRDGDQHYDIASAFIKSMRGSDVDAAVHYLARMMDAGEDPRFLARRIVILACEDIGMADPTALVTAVAAAQAVALVGMPEARIVLTQAVIHCALAPKSAAVYAAITAALTDVRAGLGGAVPPPLRDASYGGARRHGHGIDYRYPHDDPAGVVAQHYAPEGVAGRRYYQPTAHGAERPLRERLEKLRAVIDDTGAAASSATHPPGEGHSSSPRYAR
jgi:putative ATPase